MSNSALLGLIDSALNAERTAATKLIWYFVGCCLVMLLSRVASEVLLLRLSQTAVFELRVELSRRILAAPLRRGGGIQTISEPRNALAA